MEKRPFSSQFLTFAKIHEAQSSDYVVIKKEEYVKLLNILAEMAKIIEEEPKKRRKRRSSSRIKEKAIDIQGENVK